MQIVILQDDGNAQELAALKVVIKCVEEYKLESDYPLDPLYRRADQLSKLRDRKRTIEPPHKRQRQRPDKQRTKSRPRPDRGPYLQSSHVGAITTYDYQVPGQTIYSQQGSDQRLPVYPHDNRVVTPAYGSYIDGSRSSLQLPHQPYM